MDESESRERAEVRTPSFESGGGGDCRGDECLSPEEMSAGPECDFLIASPVLRRKRVQGLKRKTTRISSESEDSLTPRKLFIIDT